MSMVLLNAIACEVPNRRNSNVLGDRKFIENGLDP